VLAIGGKPGSHEISAWEYFFAAYAVADADPDAALAELDAGLAERPEHPALYYHRACINARAGRLDEARQALDRALELDPELKQWADEDDDLAALRVAGEP
jgi:tetratricopeptide (TPR) repeat protein